MVFLGILILFFFKGTSIEKDALEKNRSLLFIGDN